MAIINVVKWDGDPHTLVYKHPDCEMNTKTQLIVAESQEAVFVKEGQFFGPFGPGRHVLDTKNYPFLTSLMKATITGGHSPFTAEVWFVQKAIPLDNKWGTLDPVFAEDPLYHIVVPLRGFGQFGLQVTNSMKFLSRVVGRLRDFNTDALGNYFRGIIVTKVKDCFCSYLTERKISILHVGAKLNEISEYLQSQLSEACEDYGVTIFSFMVNSIAPDQNDPGFTRLKEALAKKAEMDIIGYTYQQERSFDTMETAAGNAGNGGVMNAGIGMGMGLGMMAPMNQIVGGMSQNLNLSGNAQPQQNSQPESFSICDKCGAKNAADAKFCNNCGDVFYRCPACGTDNDESAAVCRSCGKPMPRKCSQCGAKVDGGVKFCSNCGASMVKSCPKCGQTINDGIKFCSECGTKID